MTPDIEAPGGTRAYQDKVDIFFWLRELMLTYKYGEKGRFRKALDILKPYMDDRLVMFYEDIYQLSTWTNPITGKKGY